MNIQAVHFAVAAALAAQASAQVDWIPRGSGLLTMREGAAMAYDDQRGCSVVFGGSDWLHLFDDTWKWAGVSWVPTLAPQAPSPRVWHAMAYDGQRGVVVLFGGWQPMAHQGDTWEFDGTHWTLRATTGPSARSGAALAYDWWRGRTVLFGGATAAGLAADTWEWDGSLWLQVATTGPESRSRHGLAYDSQRRRTVLFGGHTMLGITGDTWEWDGGVWTLRAIAGPANRDSLVLGFDAGRNRTVLFGGQGDGAVLLGDTWEWDGVAWVQLATSAMVPRAGHAMAYDIQRHCLVLFGGYSGHLRSDTWELTSTSSFASPYGVGCGAPPLSLQAIPLFPPRIGGTAGANVTQVPAGFAVMALGWNQQVLGPLPLPLSLAGMGMPGCYLLHSAEVFGLDATGGGTWSPFLLGIPDFPALIGQHIYLQAFALAPGVNPTGVVASNGLHWRIGR